jgi:hypothetical protein
MTTPNRHPVAELLDNAAAHMLPLEEGGIFPSELRVSASAYASFADLRHRELAAGFPLLVLGTPVVLDARLETGEFVITP